MKAELNVLALEGAGEILRVADYRVQTGTEYARLHETPQVVDQMTRCMARTSTHLALLLCKQLFPVLLS